MCVVCNKSSITKPLSTYYLSNTFPIKKVWKLIKILLVKVNMRPSLDIVLCTFFILYPTNRSNNLWTNEWTLEPSHERTFSELVKKFDLIWIRLREELRNVWVKNFIIIIFIMVSISITIKITFRDSSPTFLNFTISLSLSRCWSWILVKMFRECKKVCFVSFLSLSLSTE